MIGRFIRFYPAYTAEAALAMPWRRLVALFGEIPGLEAGEDLRALRLAAVGAHPGEKGQALREFSQELQGRAGLAPAEITTAIPGISPMVKAVADGSIEAEHARQRAAAERLDGSRRAAWLDQQQRSGQSGA